MVTKEQLESIIQRIEIIDIELQNKKKQRADQKALCMEAKTSIESLKEGEAEKETIASAKTKLEKLDKAYNKIISDEYFLIAERRQAVEMKQNFEKQLGIKSE